MCVWSKSGVGRDYPAAVVVTRRISGSATTYFRVSAAAFGGCGSSFIVGRKRTFFVVSVVLESTYCNVWRLGMNAFGLVYDVFSKLHFEKELSGG